MGSGYSNDLNLSSISTQGIAQYNKTASNGSGSSCDSDPRFDSESDANFIITTDGSVSFEGGAISTLSVPDAIRPCYDVLLGRKKRIGLKTKRIEIILDLLDINKASFIPSLLKNDISITE